MSHLIFNKELTLAGYLCLHKLFMGSYAHMGSLFSHFEEVMFTSMQ